MVKERKKIVHSRGITVLILVLAACAVCAHYIFDPWGFYWKVPDAEAALRMTVVQTAAEYLGCNEADGSHKQIIDLYNSHEPLAMGYKVQYSDSWCATFVSAVAIRCGLTQVIPTECGCERQIGLFQQLETWVEDDAAIPLPGDLIYYDWIMEEKGECDGWADHVGIVVGTKWPFIKVIEGNLNDSVSYHYLKLDDVQIRGYARPDYAGFLQQPMP